MSLRISLFALAMLAPSVLAHPLVDHAAALALPPGAVARIGTASFVHPGGYGSLRFSPDGKFLVSTSEEGVRVWDTASGNLLLRDSVGGVQTVLFHPRNPTLFFLGRRTVCWSWDALTGQKRPLWEEAERSILAAAIAPDGKLIAVQCADGLHLVDTDKNTVTEALAHSAEESAGAMQFSPDGRLLAVSSKERLRLWDCKQWKLLRSHTMAQRSALAFRPDSKGLAVLGSGGLSMLLTDFEEKCPEFGTVADACLNVQLAADGKSFLSVRSVEDTGLHLVRLDVNTGKTLFSLPFKQRARHVAIDPTQKLIALCDGFVRLLDFKTGKRLSLTDPYPEMSSPAFLDPEGKVLACVTGGDTVTCWNIPGGKVLKDCKVPTPAEPALILSPHGKYMVAWGIADAPASDFMLIDRQTEKEVWRTKFPKESYRYQRDRRGLMAFSPDETQLAEVVNGQLNIYDVKTGKSRHVPHQLWGERVHWSADGRLILADYILVESATGQMRHVFSERDLRGTPAFSADNKVVALLKGGELEIDVVELGTYRSRCRLGVGIDLLAVAISPDSRRIAAGDSDGKVHVWDQEGNYRHRFDGHAEKITALSFSRDGRRLVSTSVDHTAVVWDMSVLAAEPNVPAPPRDAALKIWWSWLTEIKGTRHGVAMTMFQDRPKESVAFFRASLAPVRPIPAEQLQRWAADLSSPSYTTRLQAMKSLRGADEQALPILEATLKTESLEARFRAAQLLRENENLLDYPHRLQHMRAVEVLERIATPEARALLEEWAQGDPPARLTREASAALKRLP
jgi:WD40 repeat protein